MFRALGWGEMVAGMSFRALDWVREGDEVQGTVPWIWGEKVAGMSFRVLNWG